MMDKLSHPALLWISRWLLGGIFLYAAYSKITDLGAFATSISHYDMVPAALIPLFATVLAGVEVSAGLALVTGLWRRGSAAITTAMLVMFIIAIGMAYARGLSINCGCFTADLSLEKASEIRADMLTRLIEDIGMVIVSAHLLFQETRLAKNRSSSTPD